MKRLREALNLLVGVGIRYDTFTIQIQGGLLLVNNNGLAVNIDKVLCCVVGNVSQGLYLLSLNRRRKLKFKFVSNELLRNAFHFGSEVISFIAFGGNSNVLH